MFSKKIRTVNKKLIDQVKLKPCVICKKCPSDPHHIKHQGAGGGDEYWNLLNVCRYHHSLIHQVGLNKVVNDHLVLKLWLMNKGWYFDTTMQKWINQLDIENRAL